MNRVHARVYAYPWASYVIPTVVVALFACIALYIFFVFETVSYTADKERIGNEISTETASVGTLDAEYVSLNDSINQNTATELGFTQVASKNYISRPALGLSYEPIE